MDTKIDTDVNARLQSVLQISATPVDVMPIYALFKRVEELNSKQAHIEALWRHMSTLSKTPYVQKSLAHIPQNQHSQHNQHH